MKTTIHLVSLFISISLLLSSCGDSSQKSYSSEYEEYYDEDDGYENGTYCAEIEYYNPDTGTSSTYTLNVEVEDNELATIYWSNGGWLDEDHFYPEELDEDGYCSFSSDKGYDYEVQITGSECNYTDANRAENDYRRELAAITCPECGYEKDEYDDFCQNCQDEIEDKKEHTCPRCGEYDSFMYSYDDYCSDCEDEVENTCSRCGGREYNVNGGICDDCQEEEDDNY